MRTVIVMSAVVCSLLSVSDHAFCKSEYPFKGDIDFQSGKVNFSLELADKSSIVAGAQRGPDGNYHVLVNVERLQTPMFDFSSAIETSIEYKDGLGASPVSGKLWSNYTLIDYEPVRELSGQYEIRDAVLRLTSVTLGQVSLSGTVDLKAPFDVDLLFDISGMDMEDFLEFWMGDKKYSSTGIVSGQIRAAGNITELTLKGSLNTSSGFVDKLNFDNINLNVEGIYPEINIAHSTLSQAGGMSFNLAGKVDLSDKQNFKKQLKALDITPLVSEEDGKMEWTIRRIKNEESTTEFKYLIRDSDISSSSMNRDVDMLGIERKVEF